MASKIDSAIRFALHGGAGVIDRTAFSTEREAVYRAELERITRIAYSVLFAGASALDAVELAVRELEACEYFNAGRGAVLNADGEVELDASIMDGQSRAAGAVAAARTPQFPVSLARAVLREGSHVLLTSAGADRFANEQGVAQVSPEHFIIDARRAQLADAKAAGRISLDHDERYPDPKKMGTVGAVARDTRGHLAAATSTGGMTNKRPGRVGDTPIIGAGTWADDATVAISATGHGEFFMRSVLAYQVHARIAFAGASLDAACAAALQEVSALGGSGGLIAIDHSGAIALPFTSPGMYRGWVAADGQVRVAIYRE
jgi:L-asparaginase / beta-aspartyl-peptidase